MAARLTAASAEQVQIVLDFWSVAAEDTGRPADEPHALRRLIERDPDALVLAWADDALVGTLVAGWDGWRFHLYRLAVHPDHRRKGIARQLLEAAEARAHGLGVTRADAMVLDDNAPAHRFWAGAGYRRQPDWGRWVRPLP